MVRLTSGLVVGAGFLGVGGYALITGFRELLRGLNSEEWPRIKAEVLESRLSAEPGESSRLYAPLVRYRYRVGPADYESDRVAFGGPFQASWRGPAQKVVDRYHAGQRVMIAVSPTDPRVAVLEPGAPWYAYVTPAVGAGFGAYGAVKLLEELGVAIVLPFLS